MALILCIESAMTYCSVSLSENSVSLSEQTSVEKMTHASQITLLIEQCMKPAERSLKDLDAIAVSMGPGSYTALRVGMSTAKGICYALDKPMLTISTLRSLAHGYLLQAEVLAAGAVIIPMIDARRMEVYAAVYDQTLQELEGPAAKIITSEAFRTYREAGRPIVLTGDGAAKCSELLGGEGVEIQPMEARATFMGVLAEAAFKEKKFADLAYTEPLYLKPPNITKPRKIL